MGSGKHSNRHDQRQTASPLDEKLLPATCHFPPLLRAHTPALLYREEMASQESSRAQSPGATNLEKSDMSTASPEAETENSQPPGEKSIAAAATPPAAPPAKEPEYVHGFKLFNILAALTLVTFLMLLDGTIVVAAAPRITDDFKSLNDIGWYGAAYQLGRQVRTHYQRNKEREANMLVALSSNHCQERCT
jgi:hypothetical protein